MCSKVQSLTFQALTLPHGSWRGYYNNPENSTPTPEEVEVTSLDPSTSTSTQTTIGSLYPEVLTHIFQFLPLRDKGSASQVCKYWRDVSYSNKKIWRGVIAKIHLKPSTPSIYPSLTLRGINQVQVLSLKRSLRDLVLCLPTLVNLNLSGCYTITDWILNTALFSYPVSSPSASSPGSRFNLLNLTALDLSLCKQVSDLSLGRIALRAVNLVTLNLGGCCLISDRGLLLLSFGLSKLRSLNLRSCSLISDLGIGFLTGVVEPGVLEEPRFHEFLLRFGLVTSEKFEEQSKGALADDLRKSSSSSPAPTTLFSNEYQHQPRRNKRARLDDVLLNLARVIPSPAGPFHEPGSRRPNPNPNHVQQQCAICRQVNFATNQQRRSTGSSTRTHKRRRSPGAKRADHGAKSQVFEREETLGPAIIKIGPETKFGTLDLETLVLQDCQKLTDESLNHIGSGLKKLSSINLSFCINVTDSGLKYLAKLKSLREVNLRSGDNITDAGLSNLAGTTLESLDVSFCDKITDLGCTHISNHMSGLKSLSLSACNISDSGLTKLGNVLTELITLNVGQCSKITDEALKGLVEKCREIEYVDLYGCTGISKEGLDFVFKMPKVKCVNLGLWHVR